MLVREIMTCPAFSVHKESSLDVALRLMAQRKVTALPVVEDGDRLVGVLSEIDLLRRAVEPDRRAHFLPVSESEPLPDKVGEVMTSDPRTTTEGADIADLLTLFTESSFKSLPVVRGDILIGVISRSDVIRALWRTDEDLLADLTAVFRDYGQDSWTITVRGGVVEVAGVGTARERNIAAAIAHSVLGVRRVHVTEQAGTEVG
ncbi:MAG: CBS domain-containing protein [Micrococcales bacterium]|nr:CBS domain-containing protein [Micrococcales bacterium]